MLSLNELLNISVAMFAGLMLTRPGSKLRLPNGVFLQVRKKRRFIIQDAGGVPPSRLPRRAQTGIR